MDAAAHTQRLEEAFTELHEGNGRVFLDRLSSEVRWTARGNTEWSRTYDGKQEVITNLMVPQKRHLAGRPSVTVERLIAEEDHVVVLAHGRETATEGTQYTSEYCWVFRFENGKAREVTEYRDTQLVADVLEDPQENPA